MASTLSSSAIHRIIFFIDSAPIDKKEDEGVDVIFIRSDMPRRVNRKWKAIYELYRNINPAPPRDYLDSLELDLVLKGEVEDEDVRAIFAHGKPMEFWGCPRQLVSKIVEAFTNLQEEPEYLDVTITALDGFGATRPSEAWSEVYTAYLPCHACINAETVKERRIHPDSSQLISPSAVPAKTANFAVDKFHISSERFRKRLTLELHYQLEQRRAENVRELSSFVQGITIRLTDQTCSAQKGLPGTANRSSATPLLLPEFASDVFGFLDRAHVGSSLLASRDLSDLICQLNQRLPVHHLKCAFENELVGLGFAARHSGYWLTIRHFRRDMSYTDVRCFKVPSTAGPEKDSALIRRYLSNSHVADLQPPKGDFLFTIKMLASLAACNVSVDRVLRFQICSSYLEGEVFPDASFANY